MPFLPLLLPKDPADRVIGSTAPVEKLALITADDRIRRSKALTQFGKRVRHKLPGFSNRELHEIVRADDAKNHSHGKWELPPARIVHNRRIGQVIPAPSALKLASADGENVFDPLALAAIGKRDRETVGRAKDVYWSVISLARFPADVSDDPKAGQPSREPAGDPVGDREIEPRQRFLPEPHKQHSRQRDCHQDDDRDRHAHASKMPRQVAGFERGWHFSQPVGSGRKRIQKPHSAKPDFFRSQRPRCRRIGIHFLPQLFRASRNIEFFPTFRRRPKPCHSFLAISQSPLFLP